MSTGWHCCLPPLPYRCIEQLWTSPSGCKGWRSTSSMQAPYNATVASNAKWITASLPRCDFLSKTWQTWQDKEPGNNLTPAQYGNMLQIVAGLDGVL